jgi:hypothetical protein
MEQPIMKEWCTCNYKSLRLFAPPSLTPSSADAHAAGCASSSLGYDGLHTEDTLAMSGLRMDDTGLYLVLTFSQSRIAGRKVTGVSLGSCSFSADNQGEEHGRLSSTSLISLSSAA